MVPLQGLFPQTAPAHSPVRVDCQVPEPPLKRNADGS